MAQRLGIQLKYQEPPERALPNGRWRIYEMEGDAVSRVFPVSEHSYYLLGRDMSLRELLKEQVASTLNPKH